MLVMEELPRLNIAKDLDSSRRERKPNINVTPNRTVLQNLGMSANELISTCSARSTASK